MNGQELQLLRRLEYIKYITLTQGRVKHSSNSERIHYSDGNNGLTLNTPEGLTLKIINFRINYKRPDGEGKCFITIDWARDDNGNYGANYAMTPSLPIKNMANGNKLFIFHSDQFRDLPEENRNYYNSEIDNFLNIGGFWLHQYSILIEIEQENGHFQAFMNMEYGSESSVGTWKYFFTQALNQALDTVNPNINNLLKYDSRILPSELNFNQLIQILEKFEVLNLENDFILGMFNVKDDSLAVQLLNYLRSSSTNLNHRLYLRFLQESSIEDFSKYNEALIGLGNKFVNQATVEMIALNEVDTYLAFPNEEWNIYNELAKNADVFCISTNIIYNTHLGMFNYFPDGAVVDLNPFNTQFLPELPDIPEVDIDLNKIHFAYSAVLKSKPLGDDSSTIVRFPKVDPFKIVKLYIIDKPEDLNSVGNYKGFIDIFLNSQNHKVRVAYLPAICAYNLYVLNFRAQHDAIAATLLQGALLGLGTALTFGSTIPYSIPWYLGSAANMSSILAMTINAPGVKQQILDEYGQDGQDFIDAIDYIVNATIVLDFAHAGFYGIRNFTYFISNKSNLILAKDLFLLRYSQLSIRLRKILTPFYESVFVNIEKALEEAAEYEALLAPHLLPDRTWSWVVQYKLDNGFYPQLSLYMKPSSITQFQTLLEAEGVTFFVTKREIINPVNPNWIGLPKEKFAGISSHMNIAESNFLLKGGNIEQLINDLAVSSNKFTFGDEIYRVHINYNNTKGISMKMPDGNSPGSLMNPDWRPGGFLKSFRNLTNNENVFAREAVFFKSDGSLMIHNKDWDTFVNLFDSGSVTKIYP